MYWVLGALYFQSPNYCSKLLEGWVNRSVRDKEYARKRKRPEPPSVEGYQEVKAKFDAFCETLRLVWEAGVADALAEAKSEGRKQSRAKAEEQFAQNAKDDFDNLTAELDKMLVRTTIILAVTTALFAVYALKPGSTKNGGATTGLVFLGITVLLNGLAFILAVRPLGPPIRRAWKDTYDRREYRTLLATSPFRMWCYYTWLGNRRTPVITKYKKSHSLVVPLLWIAAIIALVGTGLGVIFR